MSTNDKKIQKKIVAVDDAIARNDTAGIKSTWSVLRPSLDDLVEDLRVPHIQAPTEEWVRGFLTLANEDLDAASALHSRGGCAAVTCMLLQMTFEKIGKAQLARSAPSGFARHRQSHVTASRLLETLNLNPHLQDFRHNYKRVLPYVRALERAHPAVAKQNPHLEYPWEEQSTVRTPAKHLEVVRDLFDPTNRALPELIRLANDLIKRFDELFS